jgi:hypothetical protein
MILWQRQGPPKGTGGWHRATRGCRRRPRSSASRSRARLCGTGPRPHRAEALRDRRPPASEHRALRPARPRRGPGAARHIHSILLCPAQAAAVDLAVHRRDAAAHRRGQDVATGRSARIGDPGAMEPEPPSGRLAFGKFRDPGASGGVACPAPFRRLHEGREHEPPGGRVRAAERHDLRQNRDVRRRRPRRRSRSADQAEASRTARPRPSRHAGPAKPRSPRDFGHVLLASPVPRLRNAATAGRFLQDCASSPRNCLRGLSDADRRALR